MQNKNKRDYNFGITQERAVLPELQKLFGESLQKSANKYCQYDFFNDECLVELKSRRCKSTTYPTTMIGAKKLELAADTSVKVYFCFNFVDGLFYHQVDPDFDYTPFISKGGRIDRGKPEMRQYIYLPVDKLIKII
jgi:hypothetical protein